METKKIFSFNSRCFVFTRRIAYAPMQCKFPEHSHSQMEIVLCNKGRHAYNIEGSTVVLEPNTLVAIAPGVRHQIIVGEDDYDRYSVIIHMSILPKDAMDDFKSSYFVSRISPTDEIYLLFKKAEHYAQQLPPDTHNIIFPALAVELYYLLVERGKKAERVTPSETVNRAVSYIDENFATIKNICEICDKLYISKSYLHALFRKYMKKTPLAYLNERRLSYARMKIFSGDRPTRVFSECGFEDYTSFYRSFKKHYGTAPSALSALKTDIEPDKDY